ncbi:D-ribose pyranase [Enterococcus innesii]|uniref:D-ribose pyranase n=1 Tax=Enterococcus innesii TaxID=2839759 RepID=UPI0020913AC1|nr:D-ribose pyranase [Enterococcus innesii]MCO5497008.1 D-ribose pyranase [Enterococcus innesii]
MKKHGALNSEIDKLLADLGHTDQLTIGDLGLPVPTGVKKIDLTLKLGSPSFEEVLSVMQQEMAVEAIVLAEEIKTENAEQWQLIQKTFPNVPIRFVPHEAFKEETKESKAIIRTGEATPYSNIILQAAVIF